jgi:6-phosphogluconate dehydrogenase
LADSLEYFDSFTSEKLSSNLIQAQRDFFGAHGYERFDNLGKKDVHSEWSKHDLKN